MPLNCSSAFRARILGNESFNDIMGGGVIRIFSGVQPSSADQLEQGTLLGVATLNGGPWTAGAAANGIQWSQIGTWMMPVGQIVIVPSFAGEAAWFRIVGNAPDDGGASYSLPRIDGSIGTVDAPKEMAWDALGIEMDKLYPFNTLIFALPPLT